MCGEGGYTRPYISSQSLTLLLTGLKFSPRAGVAGQAAPGPAWAHLPVQRLQVCTLHHTWLFHVGFGDQTEFLVLMLEAVCRLGFLPSPKPLIF